MTEEEKKTLSDLFEAMGKTGAQFQIGQVIGSQTNTYNYYGDKQKTGMKTEEDVRQAQDTAIPEVLEKSALWEQLRDAGLVDESGLPTVSRPEAAMMADLLAERLNIAGKWKLFEQLWHRNNMRNDYNKALDQKKSLAFQEKLKKILG